MASFLLDYDELFADLTTGGFDRVIARGHGARLADPRLRRRQGDAQHVSGPWATGLALLSLRYLSSLTEDSTPAVVAST